MSLSQQRNAMWPHIILPVQLSEDLREQPRTSLAAKSVSCSVPRLNRVRDQEINKLPKESLQQVARVAKNSHRIGKEVRRNVQRQLGRVIVPKTS